MEEIPLNQEQQKQQHQNQQQQQHQQQRPGKTTSNMAKEANQTSYLKKIIRRNELKEF